MDRKYKLQIIWQTFNLINHKFGGGIVSSHNRIMQRIAAWLLLFMVTLSAFASTSEKAVRTLMVGYYPAPGLMNGAEDNATKSGYAFDIMQEIANHTGWQYHYVYGSFEELYQKLKNGEIDLLPYVTKTPERTHEVLFTKLPIGDECLYIGSLKNDRFISDLSVIKGKKIGTIRSAFYNSFFMEMVASKGLDCELVPFHLAKERTAALASGAVDYVLELSTAYQSIGLHAVYEFGDKYPFYLAVAPSGKDLLAELDRVLEKLDSENPGFFNSLKLRYFRGIPLFKTLSAEGKAWLDSHPVIRIGAYDHDEPYVIKNTNGTASGIAPEFVSFMLKSLSLGNSVEWKLYNGRESALKALYEGEIDLLNPYYCSYGDAAKDGVLISASAFNSSFSVLYRGNYSSETMAVIATPITRLGALYVRDNYPKATVVPCQNGYDCIDKMLAGEANCVVMHSDALMEIAKTYDEDFQIKPLNAACPVCFAALPANVALMSVIAKAIPFLTDVDVNAILDKYNVEKNIRMTTRLFIKEHQKYFYGAIIILLIIFIVILLHHRRIIAENMRALEGVREKDRVLSEITKARYGYNVTVNLNTLKCSVIRGTGTEGAVDIFERCADYNEVQQEFDSRVTEQ